MGHRSCSVDHGWDVDHGCMECGDLGWSVDHLMCEKFEVYQSIILIYRAGEGGMGGGGRGSEI